MNEQGKHFIYPSTLFVSKDRYLIHTILGSCVAVCLYSPKMKIGGMNHYMLPLWNGQGLASPKFGTIAIPKLIEKMGLLGSNNKFLVAKLFGGANMFESKLEQFRIGDRNIAIAKEILHEYKIKIVAESTGGELGRKIEFNTYTGEVSQKIIKKNCKVEV
ncbi:MAG: chemotaxis protein CheD [Bacteroidales bacterium]|nr:chemotaxis protein CheD [Bacteroidales bacterium]